MNKAISKLKKLKNIKGFKLFAITALSVMLLAAMLSFKLSAYSEDTNSQLSDSLIRLHVRANSDSAEDQELKHKVRDAVIAYMKELMEDSEELEETRKLIAQNLEKIKELAKNEVIANGSNYEVKAFLGKYPFPTKQYGDIALPAGYYRALRVVIGNGEGANWWCVLFPPLCFVDASHGTVPDSVKEDLQKSLTDEEYKLVISADDESEIPVKVKFKIVEFFQDSKIKFTGLVNRIFKNK